MVNRTELCWHGLFNRANTVRSVCIHMDNLIAPNRIEPNRAEYSFSSRVDAACSIS